MVRLIAFVLLILCTITAAQQTNVAVNDLKSHGIGESETAIISERVRSELLQTGKYRVMERGEMNMILSEQGFQQSGACDDASCLVEVGQILAVDQIITGSIGLIGSMYTLNLKTISVESGEIIASSNVDYHGSISGFLSQSVALGVQKLTKGESAGQNSANLSLYTNPEGADVTINGKELGKTPLKNIAVAPGEVALLLTKRNFMPMDSIFYMGQSQNKSLTFTLQEKDGATPKKNKVFKVLGFTVGGGMAVAGVVTGIALDNKIKEYQKEYDGINYSDPERFAELRSNMEDAELFRNISYVVAGAGGALITVSFFF